MRKAQRRYLNGAATHCMIMERRDTFAAVQLTFHSPCLLGMLV